MLAISAFVSEYKVKKSCFGMAFFFVGNGDIK